MISSKSRALYIGASDTSFVVGNWKTDTFRKWWQEKLGIDYTPKWSNRYTMAGTYYEHAILDTIEGVIKDAQILLPELRLRVNYDGIVEGDVIQIHEVKTYKAEKAFKVSKAYWRQAQVEMYAAMQRYQKPVSLTIDAYPMTEEHYRDYFLPVDRDLIESFPVGYDPAFIDEEYLPKQAYLKQCIDKGAFPEEDDYEKYIAGQERMLPYGGDNGAA
jgi:hypothetical protein